MRIVVVGAGIMGLSAAWALARAGHEVEVLDQDAVPNRRGSSFDQHRLIRFAYGPARGYARMVGEAYEAWGRLWVDLGRRLYAATGTLVVPSGDESWARETAVSLEGLGQRVRWLEPTELEATFPLLSAAGAGRALHVASGGVLLADRILEALATNLRSRGVRIRERTPVREIDPERASATLASGGAVQGDAMVVAAGAWAPRLAKGLGARVRPSRQVLVYLRPPADLAAEWASAPMLLDIGHDAGFYLVPPVAGTDLKAGDHRFTLQGDPDELREPRADEARAVFDLCRRRLRRFEEYRLASSRVCFYTVEPSERFIVEPLGAQAWLISACSGHAFKFGTVIGEAVAAALEGRQSGEMVRRWAAGEEGVS